MGKAYGEAWPTSPCPYCETVCYADWVDIGVGFQQSGPFHCTSCHASEIGPYDEARDLTEAEQATGWYAPGAEPGSSANVIDGRVVSADEMQSEYRNHFLGNPLYEVEGYVKDWFEKTREKHTQ